MRESTAEIEDAVLSVENALYHIKKAQDTIDFRVAHGTSAEIYLTGVKALSEARLNLLTYIALGGNGAADMVLSYLRNVDQVMEKIREL